MQVRNSINQQVLMAATALLQPFAPDLSPGSLVAALKAYDEVQPGKGRAIRSERPEKPWTRKEVAEFLGITLPTLNRYLNNGTLRRIKLGPRMVRIDPESVRNLQTGATGEE